MILYSHHDVNDIFLCVGDMNIPLKDCVKLLGVFIDCEMDFSHQLPTYVHARQNN